MCCHLTPNICIPSLLHRLSLLPSPSPAHDLSSSFSSSSPSHAAQGPLSSLCLSVVSLGLLQSTSTLQAVSSPAPSPSRVPV
ncbi:hypothetical protein SCP_0311420 [Sparassis crispa]|uniref:Uncharacterized protein n=1 Tax=Sparassis crispa TaxID=139825 RepID=A0A401GH33_9APHY|nr:hypothetical protein SCP_0311420 [Sparassis crispa]GBE81413.1 hypothetical protein SCP_0311420 [Sparassis crispa]